jgi:integrase
MKCPCAEPSSQVSVLCGAPSVFSVGLAGRQGVGALRRSSKALRRRARANAIALTRAELEGRSPEGALSFNNVRLHDLRHSFASLAVQAGGSAYLLHKQSRTNEIYAHASDEPLLATAELAAQRIALALNGRQQRNRRD